MQNKITITQMAGAVRQLKAEGQKFTLMGIGPMSMTLIDAVIELAKEKDFPVMFIASRNQIDSDKFGAGYVCGFNQKRFVEKVNESIKAKGFDGLCYLCRDHGGPWQRDAERAAKLPAGEAMRIAEESYLDDIQSGFDLLHIDPTKDPHAKGTVPLDVVLERTVKLIRGVEDARKKYKLGEVAYEVGTEETDGGLTSIEAFSDFAKKLTAALNSEGLPLPVYIVGQTGTLTRLTENESISR